MADVKDYLEKCIKILDKAQNVKGKNVSGPGDWMKLKFKDIVDIKNALLQANHAHDIQVNRLKTEIVSLKTSD